jgi:hypothetical protein
MPQSAVVGCALLCCATLLCQVLSVPLLCKPSSSFCCVVFVQEYMTVFVQGHPQLKEDQPCYAVLCHATLVLSAHRASPCHAVHTNMCWPACCAVSLCVLQEYMTAFVQGHPQLKEDQPGRCDWLLDLKVGVGGGT